MKTVIVLMALVTGICVSIIAYAHVSSSGKRPMDYGIWKAYFAEMLETKPQSWNTTQELGITFGQQMDTTIKTYEILIDDPEKALPWMETNVKFNVKYEDDYYRLVWLWGSPGLPESIKQMQEPILKTLGTGWVSLFVVTLVVWNGGGLLNTVNSKKLRGEK